MRTKQGAFLHVVGMQVVWMQIILLVGTLPLFGGIAARAESTEPGTITAPPEASSPDGADNEFFEKKIRPVLIEHCYSCHSADSKILKGGLRLDTKADTLKGGDTGPAVVPKDPDKSLLIEALRYDTMKMPPKGKLPEAVVADFVKWVGMGAPDPRVGKPDPAKTKPAIDLATARKFWSFVPPVKPALPKVRDTGWPRADIDFFTLAKMEAKGLKPVAPAGKRELIRRATFDLTGLPPTPEEVDAFLADSAPDAFARVVNRLLATPHYGERWGRHWLDVARYAEDQAHTFSVTPNTNGYRYRDWVIKAFNTDMPYDRFIKEQIAGDLLGEKDETMRLQQLVGLGFFGLGPVYYKNTDAAKAAADELDDRIDTLTRGFLGLTVSCARCHDHKFDPIPQQDYYSLAGIFQSSRLHNAPLVPQKEVDAFNKSQAAIKQADEAIKQIFQTEKQKAREARVSETAKYMIAVWKLRASGHQKPSDTMAQLAAKENLDEQTLKRWARFLDIRQKGKSPALKGWYDLFPTQTARIASGEPTVPPSVVSIANGFQSHIQALLDQRDGKTRVTPIAAEAPQTASNEPGHARFISPLITKKNPSIGINVDITGAKELYLVVTDGGNGIRCDHADWAQPRLVGPKGEMKLTNLKWKSATSGTGGVNIDANENGRPIRIGGKSFASGVGTHAPSQIVYDLPAGYTRFVATGGLDNSGSDQGGGCGEEASIQFRVYTEQPADFSMEQADLLTAVLGEKGLFAIADDKLDKFLVGPKQKEFQTLKTQLEELKKNAPPMYPIAHSLAESSVGDMKVFLRGNPATQGPVAPRRFLKVIAGDEPPAFKKGSGRLELASAIADPNNPLTARVMVNRIWQHHFGRGLVGTPDNFGALGEAPSHPELLDFLARRFIESGWSIKALHRDIMLSATYQLGTDRDAKNYNVDADNRYLWRMNRRRLDVEAWRDALLAVSGRLDPKLEGPSTNLADANNKRRTVYAMVSRHELDSLLRLFDFPDANISSSKRNETTVPQQQLFVINSPFMIDQAKALAARLHTEAPKSDDARIRRAFVLAFGRPATEKEIQLGLAYLGISDSDDAKKGNQLSRWDRYAQVLLGSNEFLYLD